jgi:hypothetical protein
MNPTQKPSTTAQPGATTPADILRGAALYLERHGWTQGVFFDFDTPRPTPTPPACAFGAIHIATFGTTSTEPVDRADYDDPDVTLRTQAERCLVGYLDLDLTHDGIVASHDLIMRWNDQDHATAEQVINDLRAAAQEWDDTHNSNPGGAQ